MTIFYHITLEDAAVIRYNMLGNF